MGEPASQTQEKLTRTPSESDASKSSASDGSTQVARSEPSRSSKGRKGWRRWIPFIGPDPEAVDDGRFETSTYEQVDSYSVGYPRLAAYQNSDPTFRIYKRFGTLRNRVILYRQQELAILEGKLKQLDEEDDEKNNFRTRSMVYDKADSESERMKLIDQIDDKLKQYDDLLERERRSGLMQKPSRRYYRSLVNYIWNHKPIVQTEAQFLQVRDDFVQLSERSESPLEHIIDYIICNWIPTAWLRRQFSSESQVSKTSDKFTTLTSPRKVFVLARVVATAWALVLIIVPLTVLASDTLGQKTKLVTVMASLVAFPVAIQIAARPRTLELFVATATYCAVLTTLLVSSSTFSLSELQSQLALIITSSSSHN